MARQVKRAFKYRFYPTDEQATELSRTFGCVRLVYNKALEERSQAWDGEQRRISYTESSVALTEWKKTQEFAFLNEVSSVPLQQALRHLQSAFANFFAKRTKYPRFKSRKKAHASAEYTRSAFTWRDGRLTLAKMARMHARITDRRRDHLHKLTARLVRANTVPINCVMVIEDLPVRNLLANHALARAVSDTAWGELRGQLEYKCAWHGRELVVIDRYFPSSKLCEDCGVVRGKLPLNLRMWTCRCGARHDRDVNAARNILAAGLAVTACGDDVRPQRESSRTGQSSAKQESVPPRRSRAAVQP